MRAANYGSTPAYHAVEAYAALKGDGRGGDQIQKGRSVIVNPRSEATGDPVVPTPKWSER